MTDSNSIVKGTTLLHAPPQAIGVKTNRRRTFSIATLKYQIRKLLFAALLFFGRALQNYKNTSVRYLSYRQFFKTSYRVLFL
jgi:hypothetical protein